MRSYDILTIGDINVDIILNKIQSLPEVGKEILADEMELVIGGSSTIFAINASSLGSRVGFMGMVGDDAYGRFMTDALASHGVNTDRVIVSGEVNTGATVVLNYDDDRANVTYPGAMAAFRFSDVDVQGFRAFKHLHVSSIFMQPELLPEVETLFREAKAAGMTTSLDTQWDPKEEWNLDLDTLLPCVDVFLPNEAEAMLLAGTERFEEALDRLSTSKGVVVIKRGSRGSVMRYNGKRREVDALLNEKLVDAVGAGDSFDAGFIHEYVKGKSLEDCQDFGNAAGAVSTMAAGGTAAMKGYDEVVELARETFGYAATGV